MRPVDHQSWNLVAASGLALAACGYEFYDAAGYSDWEYYYDECSAWNDCQLGNVCVDGDCQPAPEAIECMHEPLVDIPLPALESALTITFADLDGDGDDELVSTTANGISVVLADDSVVNTPWPETHEYTWLEPVEIDGDGLLDLAVGFPTGMVLLAGTGDGGFVHLTTHEPRPDLAVVEAIDPDGDGIDQLVATQTSESGLVWFSNVFHGQWSALSYLEASTLIVADVRDDWAPELVLDRGCALQILEASEFGRLAGAGTFKPDWHCDWHVGPLAGHEPALLSVATDVDTPLTRLTVFDAATLTNEAARVPNLRASASTLVDLHGAGEPTLALGSGSSLALVWDWSRFPEPCFEQLDGPADSLVAGDREGDGRQELAILHEGTIRLLTL